MQQRYKPLSSNSYQAHRAALRERLPKQALVVIHSNDILPSNADGILPFVQNSNLLYLTGIDQAETTLVLAYDSVEQAWQEILFLKTPTTASTLWDGDGFTQADAQALSGIQTVYWQADFERIFYQLIIQSACVYLEDNEHYRANQTVQTQNDRFIQTCKQRYPLHKYARLAPIMAQIRASKSAEEIAQIKQACAITRSGFLQVAQALNPGIREYALEAEYLHSFVRQGAKGFAFTPIIASGKNACILHYTNNAGTCQANDLVLMDIGACYGNYNADITRCLPVSGRFSPRQAAVYEAVLRSQRYAMGLLKPGVLLKNYQQQVEAFILEELCTLGLISTKEIRDNPNKARAKYFMHGVSHHLGLDVHDVPLIHQPILVGAVLTVEPGIYIQEEGIGIRLENNVLVTDHGIEDLSADIPIEINELEALMKGPV